jgi:hypothetical protein
MPPQGHFLVAQALLAALAWPSCVVVVARAAAAPAPAPAKSTALFLGSSPWGNTESTAVQWTFDPATGVVREQNSSRTLNVAFGGPGSAAGVVGEGGDLVGAVAFGTGWEYRYRLALFNFATGTFSVAPREEDRYLEAAQGLSQMWVMGGELFSAAWPHAGSSGPRGLYISRMDTTTGANQTLVFMSIYKYKMGGNYVPHCIGVFPDAKAQELWLAFYAYDSTTPYLSVYSVSVKQVSSSYPHYCSATVVLTAAHSFSFVVSDSFVCFKSPSESAVHGYRALLRFDGHLRCRCC